MAVGLAPHIPQYANTRFGSKDLFLRWLEETTKYVVTFEGDTRWWLDSRGEILHTFMHTFMPDASLNGLIVNVPVLLQTSKVAFLNGPGPEVAGKIERIDTNPLT